MILVEYSRDPLVVCVVAEHEREVRDLASWVAEHLPGAVVRDESGLFPPDPDPRGSQFAVYAARVTCRHEADAVALRSYVESVDFRWMEWSLKMHLEQTGPLENPGLDDDIRMIEG